MKSFLMCLVLVSTPLKSMNNQGYVKKGSPVNPTLYSFLNPPRKSSRHATGSDAGESVSVSDVSTFSSANPSDNESWAGSTLYEDFVDVAAEDEAAFSQEYPRNVIDSIDLSLSEMSNAAKKNSSLTSEELLHIALQIIKKKENVLKKRRALSRERSAADKLVTQAEHELHVCQRKVEDAVLKEAEIRDLEAHEQAVQKKIYDAMNLLYSRIKSSSDIALEIKEEWEDAKRPGGKLSYFESAFNKCLLL